MATRNRSSRLFALLTPFLVLTSGTARAASGSDMILFSGTQALIESVTGWLMIIAPAVCGLMIAYNFVRKMLAQEEMDKSKADKNIKNAIIAAILCVAGTAAIRWLLGFYGG